MILGIVAQTTLNARQLDVLTWVGAGCPPEVMPGTTYKTTAIALQNRRLVTVTKKRGAWRAILTEAGRHFLDRGAYPAGHWDTPDKDSTPGQLAVARRRALASPKVTGLRPVDQLIADVTAAPGGRLVVAEGSRGYWANLVSTAARHNKVPSGMVLSVERGGSWTEHVIVLNDAPAWMTADLAPIPVGDALRRPHPAVVVLRDNPNLLPFKRDVRLRALRILDALAKEATRRGFDGQAPKPQQGYRQTPGVLEITMTGHTIVVDVNELNDRVPHDPTALELADQARYPNLTRLRTHDSIPSGRLRIRVLTGCPVTRSEFADTKTIRLEDRLPQVLQEVELRAAAQEAVRRQRERDAVARQHRWERAVEVAKVEARQHHRAAALTEQMSDWRTANDIDAYLGAVTAHVATLTGAERADADQWVTWVQEYRKGIDPLNHPLRLPPDPEFTPEVMQPFMGGLSPYGPNGGYG